MMYKKNSKINQMEIELIQEALWTNKNKEYKLLFYLLIPFRQ